MNTSKRKGTDTMKNANELKAIAIAEAHRRAAECRTKSLNYLESHIYPEMEELAAEGRLEAAFYLEGWVDIKVVADELSEHGYTCSKNGRCLKIYWM
jgi:hypothetical protein